MKALLATAVTTFVSLAVWLSMLTNAHADEVKQAKGEPDKDVDSLHELFRRLRRAPLGGHRHRQGVGERQR